MAGRWIVRGGAILVVLGVAAGTWGVARGLHHRVYDQFLLPLVAHRVAGDARAPAEVARRLEDYVYLNLRLPFSAPVFETRNRDVLLRGFAYCDQAVHVYIHLLEQREMSGRMTFLYRADGVSPHTVAEVHLEGDWRVRDVLFGFAPTRPDGTGASVRDLVERPELLAESRVPVEWYQHAKVRLVRGPVRRREGDPAWPFVRQAFVRRVATLTPRWAADRLQDLYLLLPAPPMEDPRFASDPAAAALFYRARHHHVLLRGHAASVGYREFLRRYPGHPATDHVVYYLGLLQFSQLQDAEAAIRTLEQLLERFPRTVWAGEARYLLARAHAAANHCAVAAALYRRVIDGDGGGREDATERLRRLACA